MEYKRGAYVMQTASYVTQSGAKRCKFAEG